MGFGTILEADEQTSLAASIRWMRSIRKAPTLCTSQFSKLQHPSYKLG